MIAYMTRREPEKLKQICGFMPAAPSPRQAAEQNEACEAKRNQCQNGERCGHDVAVWLRDEAKRQQTNREENQTRGQGTERKAQGCAAYRAKRNTAREFRSANGTPDQRTLPVFLKASYRAKRLPAREKTDILRPEWLTAA
jgi:hypothetical protein